MNNSIRHLSCLLVVASVMVLPACKKAAEKATEAAIEHATGVATGVKMDKDGNKMTIKTDKGDVNVTAADAGGNVTLPASFPTDVILPANRKVASVVDMAGMQMVNLSTTQALNTVYADTDKGMQAGGWKRDVAMQTGDGADGGTQLAIRTGTAE